MYVMHLIIYIYIVIVYITYSDAVSTYTSPCEYVSKGTGTTCVVLLVSRHVSHFLVFLIFTSLYSSPSVVSFNPLTPVFALLSHRNNIIFI